jgi:serine/threonine-protein kinase
VSDSATLKAGTAAPVERSLPEPGSIIAGRYRIERVVGVGGMGFVYAARHVQLDELVAVKMLHPKVAVDEHSVERFLREARACVRIKNEHVVKVIDVFTGEAGQPPYMLMEFLVGEDLGQVVHGRGALPIDVAVDYILQASECIAEAHNYGIVHRDIKPSNILLTQSSDGMPLVKVLDFGISKALAPEAEAKNHNLTETTAVFGSPTYMSPEQVRSAKHVDPRADVWSLGVVLFELLTAHVPFGGESMSGLLASIVADPPRSPREFRPEIPDALQTVVLACLEKNRDRRVQSVPELAQLLKPFASPAGLRSVDVIARLNTASRISASVRPPNSGPSVGEMAFGATERSVVTNAPVLKSRGKTAFVIAGVASVVCVLAVGAFGVMMKLRDVSRANANAVPQEIAPPSAVQAPLPVQPAMTTSVAAQPMQPSQQTQVPGGGGVTPSNPVAATTADAPQSSGTRVKPKQTPRNGGGVANASPPPAASSAAPAASAPKADVLGRY